MRSDVPLQADWSERICGHYGFNVRRHWPNRHSVAGYDEVTGIKT